MQLSHQPAPVADTRKGVLCEVHEELMRRFIEEVISNGNFSVLNDLVHPNYVYRAPGQELHGPAMA